LGKFDTAVSTEVAEHIPKAKAKMLVANLAKHASRTIFFTAAEPGQWGDGHINCQPKSYWEALFRNCGWIPNEGLREKILSRFQQMPNIDLLIPWASRNLIIFTPSSENVTGSASTGQEHI
jgi:hypothetical protein